jgi:3-oxoacyl-[acyl-carrier protein] reductase
MLDLSGYVSIVTGGARGIGRSICFGLARVGSDIAVVDRDGGGAEETAKLVRKTGRQAVSIECDVSSSSDVFNAFETVAKSFPKIDVLVNNAGITGSYNPVLQDEKDMIERLDEDEWDRVFSTNVKGAFLCTKAAIPIMKSRRFGRIINIASRLAKTGGLSIDGPHYAASKAALVNFTKSAAWELAPYGITVNSVAPSLVLGTGMTLWMTEELASSMRVSVPLGRFATVDDVAYAVIFLSSKMADFITGHTLDVNGGTLMD